MRIDWGLGAACLIAASLAVPAVAQRVIMEPGSASYLGVGVQEISAERAKALNMTEERGVEVRMVKDDSPAAKAGIKEGDVVLEYNGEKVEGVAQFERLVRETPVGRQVKIAVWRNGASQTLSATIGSRPSDFGNIETRIYKMPRLPEMPVMPKMPSIEIPKLQMLWQNSVLGIEGEALNSYPQLAEFFGVKDGILVRSVIKDSAAEKAGIKAGDVIVKLDDSPVTNARDITNALRSDRAKKSLPVTVMRNKKEVTITVPLDTRSDGGENVSLHAVDC
ncbi:MAG TPA: PDZ domain-containing protein [Bryobacteraceae bacterium]|nr:PDZ domain-containing protein [Bryobacteraceae bacterium]